MKTNGSRRLQPAREKKHRLPLECYEGRVRVTFTFCIKGKKCLFTDKTIVDKFLEILTEAKNKHDCKNWVYIFMPDHLHLVLEGNSEKADLWKTVVLFKQKTGFWLSKNKVRRDLINNWEDYPFKGSLDFELEEIIA